MLGQSYLFFRFSRKIFNSVSKFSKSLIHKTNFTFEGITFDANHEFISNISTFSCKDHKKFNVSKIAFPLFLSISIQECPHFIQKILTSKISFSASSNFNSFFQIIQIHQAELIQISLSDSLSRFIIFVQDKREKSSHKTQLIQASSSMVNTSSILGCFPKSTALIESATQIPLSAQRVVQLAYKNQSFS
jgi:hypothetical protein